MASGGGFGGASDTLYVDIAARFDELERQLNNIERETTSAGERAGSGFGNTFKAGLGIAAGAVTALVGSTVGLAAESAQNVNEFQAKLGASREEAEQLGAVAEQVFGNNFGENLAEAGEAVGLVRQQLGELSNKELQKVTEGALALKDSFGTEVSESVDATKTLMEQFGLSSQEALDFIAKGYQDGLDRSGDFLDSIGEYATQFANGGATAEEFFNLMKNGMQGGMLGTDKAADAFKEFRVRIQDGSDSTAEALESLGINSEELAKKMASGQVTAADAFKLVQSKIARVTDQNLKMQAGVALLGTQYEDLGQKGAAALSMTGKSMKDMEGATSSLSAKYDNFGALAQGMWRKVQLALLPVGKELLEMANQAVPYLSKAFERLEKTLPRMIKSGVTAAKEFGATAVNVYNSVKPAITSTVQTFQKLSAAVERNKEVLIPLAAGMTAMAATFGVYKVGIVAVTAAKSAWTVATTAATAASVALRAAIAFITGPVGLAVTAIGLLVTAGVALYRNWDEIVAWAKKTWSQITGIVQNAISGAVSYLKGINMKQVGLNIVQGLVNGILAGPKLVLAAARGLGSAVINGIKGILNIQSPSRVMQELGEFTGQGFVKGLESKVPSVKKAAQDTGKAFADALKDLKLEHKIGSIDFSIYTKTLEQTAEQLRSKLKTVKEGTPAYSEWLSALSGVQKELDGLNKKSNETQQAAKKLADEMAKGRAEIEKHEAWKKYTKEIGNATKSQLQHALSTAKSRGETEKYHAINAELERRLNKVKAAQEKQTEASKKAKEELANNRAEIEKREEWERYIKYLKNATTAQLQKAQATAKAGGEIKKYEAIKDELTERLRKVTESQKKAEEAAEKHRESIKKNREEIEKQEAWEAWIKTLQTADSTHLEEIKTTAKARGEIQKYNAVKSEQKRRTDENAKSQELLAQAQTQLVQATVQAERPYQKLIESLEKAKDGTNAHDKQIDSLIDQLRKLQTEAEKQKGVEIAIEKLNLWSNYAHKLVPVVTGAMTALGGTTNEVAAQWGQDLSNMTNDITSFSTAIIKGDWLGAAITGLKTLFDWFNRNKKAAEDMAKATTSYNDQFKFSGDGYGTRTVDKYTTGILFWQTDHYTEKIDEAKKNVALAIESGFINGFSSGFNKALEQNDFSLFEKSLTESVGRSVLNGLIESFQKKAILQNIIEPAMQSYLKTGDASVFSGAISQVESVGRQFYDQVLKPIASQFGLLGSAEQTETVAKAPLPDSRISSVKVETPTVTASLNFDVLSTLATVVERAAPRIESGGQAIFEGSGRLMAAVSAIERIADKLHTRPNGDWR